MSLKMFQYSIKFNLIKNFFTILFIRFSGIMLNYARKVICKGLFLHQNSILPRPP